MIADFTWVDEYFQKVKPYIYVRLEDNLLIKRPNQVQHLNSTGALILSELLKGKAVADILNQIKAEPKRKNEVLNFLFAIRDSIEEKSNAFSENPAIIKKPFKGSFSDLPVLSEIAVTYRCNLKCAFCYAGCNITDNPIKSNKELDTKSLKKIIYKIFNEAKVPSVSFTGGEPVLRADLVQLISYAKSLGMRVNLISNGTLIDAEKVRQFKNAGLDSAQISIEGVNEFTHDNLTGVKGSFLKTLNAVKLLKSSKIHVHTNTTLNRLNINEAAQFPEFVKNTLGLTKFSMNMMIPSGSVSKNESLKLLYTEMGGVLKNIIVESKMQNVEFMWYSPLPLCIFNTIVHGLGNKGCAACDGLLSVAANGDLLPCSSFNKPLGNLLNKGFDEIWLNDESKFFRLKKFAHNNCKECEHFMLCNGACPLYWQDIGYNELNTIFEKKINMNSEFNKSEQQTIVFLLFKTLKYNYRIALALSLIIAGFVIQYYQYDFFPGIISVLSGSVLLLVRGYDNRLKMGKYNPYVKWEIISREQLDNLVKMHRKIILWDRSALDITNVLGFWVFMVVSLVVLYLLINGSYLINKSYHILAFNIIVLILPHWFTGVRRILTMPVLIMKINYYLTVISNAKELLQNIKLNYLVQLRGEKKKSTLPHDLKLKLLKENSHEDFLGMYAQISINDVNGTKYPYFYIVLVAKPDFGLKEKTKSYKPPENVIKEYSVQKDVDVLVVRQRTTYNTGYFTKLKAMHIIFKEGLSLLGKLSDI